jgi:hypothetical protein
MYKAIVLCRDGAANDLARLSKQQVHTQSRFELGHDARHRRLGQPHFARGG